MSRLSHMAILEVLATEELSFTRKPLAKVRKSSNLSGVFFFFFFRNFEQERKVQIKKIIPLSLGFLACLCGSCNGAGTSESECKLFLVKEGGKKKFTADYLLQGFWCPKCDRKALHPGRFCSTALGSLGAPSKHFLTDCDYIHLQSLFFELLFDDSSEEVQVACVRIIQRVLLHGTSDVLHKTRTEWVKCFDLMLLHKKKAVREAFCSQISFFLDQPIFDFLFCDGEFTEKTKEQKFMDKLKHALAEADDPLVFETLLEAAAEIMNAVDVQSQLFLFSLILLIDQLDNPHMTVRITASSLIKRSCYFHLKGGLNIVLSKVFHVRNELYDYLSLRLASRENIVKEFATSVLGIETEVLVKRMIPIVLPKLVVTQHVNDQAIIILHELAKSLNTDMVQLIVNWLPKVLAFALHRADERQLLSALQFYHEQTGSDNQEIFAAALPALLDELVCFADEDDSEEINKRYYHLDEGNECLCLF